MQRCRKSGVIPYFIQDSMKSIINIFQIDGKIPPNIHSTIHSIIETFHTKILNVLIQHKHKILKLKERELKTITKTITSLLEDYDTALFFESDKNINNNLNTRNKTTHIKKYNKLTEKQKEELNINNNNNNWFVSKTTTDIPTDIHWLLSLRQNLRSQQKI